MQNSPTLPDERDAQQTKSGAPPPSLAARRKSLIRWQMQIFSVTWIAYVAYYLTRYTYSAAKVGILEDPEASLILTKEMLGNIDAVYLIAYAIGQFVWGTVADRWGTKVVVAGGLFLSIVATFLMGVVPALLLFLPLMAVQGLAQATGWSALCKNFVAFFAIRQRGKMMGFWATNYIFGGLIGVPFAGWVAYTLFDSWRMAFIGGASVALVILVIFIVFQRSTLTQVGLPEFADVAAERAQGQVEGKPEQRVTWKETALAPIRNPMILRLGLAYFLLKPARYAILLWGPVIALELAPQLGLAQATAIPIAFGFAGLAAPIVAGWASDRLFGARRMPVVVISLGLAMIVLLAFIPLASSGSVLVLVAILALLGLFLYAGDSVLSALAAVDFGTDKGAAGAAGFVNGCGAIGAILGGLLPGYLDTQTLFFVMAGTVACSALMLVPKWNALPPAAVVQV